MGSRSFPTWLIQVDPDRRMVAGLFPSPNIHIDARITEQAREGSDAWLDPAYDLGLLRPYANSNLKLCCQ